MLHCQKKILQWNYIINIVLNCVCFSASMLCIIRVLSYCNVTLLLPLFNWIEQSTGFCLTRGTRPRRRYGRGSLAHQNVLIPSWATASQPEVTLGSPGENQSLVTLFALLQRTNLFSPSCLVGILANTPGGVERSSFPSYK